MRIQIATYRNTKHAASDVTPYYDVKAATFQKLFVFRQAYFMAQLLVETWKAKIITVLTHGSHSRFINAFVIGQMFHRTKILHGRRKRKALADGNRSRGCRYQSSHRV
jgi:hypothetical protein